MVTEEEKIISSVYADDAKTKFNTGIHQTIGARWATTGKIELLYTPLFSPPGTPVIYYGDEIGMGDNIYLGDRHGVRTPMQWNMNLNASSRGKIRQNLPVITDPIYIDLNR